MSLPNIFKSDTAQSVINRINKLTPTTPAQWGKMNVSQMLAHCNVTYELVYEEDKHPKPNFFMGLVLKLFVKKIVTSETPYKQSLRTAPAFLVSDDKNFNNERNRLIGYINKTAQLGENYFNNKVSHSFGRLTKTEWNNMFYKHLDHHLRQFGV